MKKLFLSLYFLLGISLLLGISILFGCAPNKAYRTLTELCLIKKEGDCLKNSLQETKEYLLGVVEFDDQGQFYNKRQLEVLLDKLREEAKENSLIMITFVHGWHHNAKEGDVNLKEFKELLERINALQEGVPGEKRKIVGVYLGWRGDSISIPYFNYITFWSRKNTAETIGAQGGITETLLELEKVKDIPLKSGKASGDNRLIIIGHSFGGLIVYSALAHTLLDRFVSNNPIVPGKDDSKPIVPGVGDLIVLINPAFEALQFANFHQLIKKREYNNYQPTLMTVLTSENDNATKVLFPIGRFFSTLFESHIDPDKVCKVKNNDSDRICEAEANKIAIGHFKPFRNGELNENKENKEETLSPEEIIRLRKAWKNDPLINFPKTVLKRLDGTELLNPYLVIKVDKNIIPDHNKIWDEKSEILPFLKSLILLSAYNPADTEEVLSPVSVNPADIEPRIFMLAKAPEYCNQVPEEKPIASSYTEKMIEARKWELRGFDQILNKNLKCAQLAFQTSYNIWPIYHHVEEILTLLKEQNSQPRRGDENIPPDDSVCKFYRKITQDFSFGMPQNVKEKFMSIRHSLNCN
ncbi:MAG: hypothetical protein HC877_20300 [Thioploca sp.]|nr:hypothetical protein [Thioploca sp.]